MTSRSRFLLGEWTLSAEDGVLRRGEVVQRLGPKPLAVLLQLAARPREVVGKEELLRTVWPDTHVEEGSLTRCIFQIRSALEDERARPRYIETIPKRGYRLLEVPIPLPPQPALVVPRRRGPSLALVGLAALAAPLFLGPRLSLTRPFAERTDPPRTRASLETADLSRALDYYRRGQRQDNENALRLFQGALGKDPTLTRARAGMADAYVQRARQFGFGPIWIHRALGEADRAVAEAPELPEAHKARALALSASGRLREAIAANRRALALNPSYGEAWSNLGRSLHQQGEWADALTCFERRWELEPSSALAAADLGGVLADLGFRTEARSWLERALALEPVATEANLEMAWLEREDGNPEGARHRLETLVAAAPQCARCWAALAASQRARGETEGARQSIERALDAAAGTPESAVLGLRLALFTDGADPSRTGARLAPVEASARQELAQGSERYLPRYVLAATAALRGQPEEALAWLEQAVGAGYRSGAAGLDPAFAGLRDRPRAKRLVEAMQRLVELERAAVASGLDQRSVLEM